MFLLTVKLWQFNSKYKSAFIIEKKNRKEYKFRGGMHVQRLNSLLNMWSNFIIVYWAFCSRQTPLSEDEKNTAIQKTCNTFRFIVCVSELFSELFQMLNSAFFWFFKLITQMAITACWLLNIIPAKSSTAIFSEIGMLFGVYWDWLFVEKHKTSWWIFAWSNHRHK